MGMSVVKISNVKRVSVLLPIPCIHFVYFVSFILQDPNDPRRYGGIPLNEGYLYYPRFSPQWLFDPYGKMAEREDHYTTIQGEKGAPIKTIAYSQAYDNAGYYSSGSLRKGGSYSLGLYFRLAKSAPLNLVTFFQN